MPLSSHPTFKAAITLDTVAPFSALYYFIDCIFPAPGRGIYNLWLLNLADECITLVGLHTKQIVLSYFKFIVSNIVSMTSSVSHLLPIKLRIQVVGLKLVVDQTLSLKC